MSYELIDNIFVTWANKHGLPVYTEYKDTEVRSIDVIGPKGQRFQLWIDEPHPSDEIINLHVWDYKGRLEDICSTLKNLDSALDEAYNLIKLWQIEGTF